MIGRGAVWLTPEQIAAGYKIPTTAQEGANMAKKALIPGHTPGEGFGLTRWLALGLGVLLDWQLMKKK